MTKMLAEEHIKALFDFNKFIKVIDIEGKPHINWMFYDMATPTSVLFNKLNEVNRKRVIFYAPLVLHDTLSHLNNTEVKELLDFHSTFEYDGKDIFSLLMSLLGKSKLVTVYSLTDKLYETGSVTHIAENMYRVASCRYFFLNCILICLYNELDNIPLDMIPNAGFGLTRKGEANLKNKDVNEILDEMFKASKLPEVE